MEFSKKTRAALERAARAGKTIAASTLDLKTRAGGKAHPSQVIKKFATVSIDKITIGKKNLSAKKMLNSLKHFKFKGYDSNKQARVVAYLDPKTGRYVVSGRDAEKLAALKKGGYRGTIGIQYYEDKPKKPRPSRAKKR